MKRAGGLFNPYTLGRIACTNKPSIVPFCKPKVRLIMIQNIKLAYTETKVNIPLYSVPTPDLSP